MNKFKKALRSLAKAEKFLWNHIGFNKRIIGDSWTADTKLMIKEGHFTHKNRGMRQHLPKGKLK